MLLAEVFFKKQYQNFIESTSKSKDINEMFQYICNNISDKEIESLYEEHNNNIYYISLFNIMYPCHYIPEHKKLYITMIIMLKFKEYETLE